MKPLFEIPTTLVPPASDAQKLFDAEKFDDAIALCQAELAAREHQFPARNLKLPQEAESYYRSWSAQSTPQLEVPAIPPPVIVAPQIDYDWQHGRHPRPRPR